jgi:hypothetical protein
VAIATSSDALINRTTTVLGSLSAPSEVTSDRFTVNFEVAAIVRPDFRQRHCRSAP